MHARALFFEGVLGRRAPGLRIWGFFHERARRGSKKLEMGAVIDIPCKVLHQVEMIQVPRYMTAGAAGADLQAAIDGPLILKSLERKLIPTGFALALPPGYEAQIRPRSGNAYKYGVTVLNSPGTIDSDYRGEIKVLLVNLSAEDFTVKPGDRIAQMVIAPVTQGQFQVVDDLDETKRGVGGYGHTGR